MRSVLKPVWLSQQTTHQAVAALASIQRLVRPPTAYQQLAPYMKLVAVAEQRPPESATFPIGIVRQNALPLFAFQIKPFKRAIERP